MTRLSFSTNLTAADTERRIISGRIVTWSEVGHTSAGPARFEPGSIELSDDIRLLREHDHTSPLGRSVSVKEHENGVDARFRIAATTAGTDALVEASENLRDGLSVGVEVLDSTTDDGVLVVTAARLDEVSLVAHPAIDSARVTSVAASEPQPEAQTQEGEKMNPETTVEVEESEAVEVVEASRPAPIARTRPRVEFGSAGEYLATFAAAGQGDRNAAQRLQAALADQVVGDNLGVVPTPIVGDLIEKEYGARPLINASRRLGMPAAGKSFVRPFVTQHTTVSVQGTELTELASQKMTIDPITVNKGTYGGALRISFQDRDWSSPEILNIVVGDLVRQYAEEVEAIAGINLATNATGTEIIDTSTADSAALMAAIYNSAAKVNAATGMMPDTMYVAPDQWALIASKVDGNGRPLFPSVVPTNAPGTSTADSFSMGIAGLRVVVSNHLAAGTVIVGGSRYFETYENVGGALSATDPSVLGLTVAYYGYFASLVTIGGGFVKWASS
jgi:HK97 family phage prohead protease